MKFNWGHGLALGMALFVGYILFFVIWSFGIDHELETDDYYAKELKFQEQIDKSKNHKMLDKGLMINLNEENVDFTFPQKVIDSGVIYFYRPSEEIKDLKIDIQIDSNGQQLVSKKNLSSGRYVIKCDWVANGKSYYMEKNVVF